MVRDMNVWDPSSEASVPNQNDNITSSSSSDPLEKIEFSLESKNEHKVVKASLPRPMFHLVHSASPPIGDKKKVHYADSPICTQKSPFKPCQSSDGHIQSHKDGFNVQLHSRLGDAYLLTSPLNFRSGHHGPVLRSDSYLRHALTSPYHQKGESVSAGDNLHSERNGETGHYVSNPHKNSQRRELYSPYSEMDRKQDVGSSPQALSCNGYIVPMDHHSDFKTPNRSGEFNPNMTAEDAKSIKSSPASSSSGTSLDSHHHHHQHHNHNPFEFGADRLHFPVFSPGLFHITSTPASTESGSFCWNIEHLAEIRPVHIDDTDIRRQLAKQSPDHELEEQAQRAIDYYFAHHMVAPSPWGEDPPPHVLPVTPAWGKASYMMSTPNETQGSIQPELTQNRKSRENSCQTTLTFPVDFEAHKCLAEYMTYQEIDDGENMSTSSLRRKLFFNADTSSIQSPVRADKQSPDHLAAALLSPSLYTPSQKATPKWERESPVKTPSSILFSSSPIRGPFGSDGNEKFTCSFSEQGALASPELSPIFQQKKAAAHMHLSGGSDDDGDHENCFGLTVKKKLQMEISDGTTPPPCLPSLNMSPISFSDSDGDKVNNPKPSEADLCATSAKSHRPLPLPFSKASQAQPSVSMEIDSHGGAEGIDVLGRSMTLKDASMTEHFEGEAEACSAFDVLPNPSSSNQDTGYHTASDTGFQTSSGSCNFHVTPQEPGPGITSENLGIYADTPNTSFQLTSRPHSSSFECDTMSVNDSGSSQMAPATGCSYGRKRPARDSGAMHTNLTNQFLSMPFQSELSTDGLDLESSMQVLPGNNSQDMHSGWLMPAGCQKSTRHGTNSPSFITEAEGSILNKDRNSSGKCRDFCSKDILLLDKDWKVNGQNYWNTKNYKLWDEHFTSDFLFNKDGRKEFGSKTKDDHILERAKQYLFSVGSPEADALDTQCPNTPVHEPTHGIIHSGTQCHVSCLPHPQGSSTPARRIMGRVARDLLGAKENSPALASEVAREIMRRAEEDLHECQHLHFSDSS